MPCNLSLTRFAKPLLGLALSCSAMLVKAEPDFNLGDLDWPDRPAMGPVGGFFIQSHAGRQGNFEVVIPWPTGQLAHFSRDNDLPQPLWHGPVFFGNYQYSGASLVEAGFSAYPNGAMKNLEVLAVSKFGSVEHWSRENGGNFKWKQVAVLSGDGVGTPSITYTGANIQRGLLNFHKDSHGDSSLFAAYAKRSGGFEYWQQWNATIYKYPDMPDPVWFRLTGQGTESTRLTQPEDKHYTGVAVALTVLSTLGSEINWKTVHSVNNIGGLGTSPAGGGTGQLVAAISASGDLVVFRGGTHSKTFVYGTHGESVHLAPYEQVWTASAVLNLPANPDGSPNPQGFRGSPCLFQGDYESDEDAVVVFLPLQPSHFGNLELMAPRKTGGIAHFIHDNGNTRRQKPLEKGWAFAENVGTAQYDQVSCLQTNLGKAKHGQMHMIARAKDQAGFDFFWRDDDLHWHGPESVGVPGVLTQPLNVSPTSPAPESPPSPATLTPEQLFLALERANVDFSGPGPIDELKGWLRDPVYTPYPAIAQGLLTLIGTRRFVRPVYIDVIAFNYEPNQHATAPRKLGEVDMERLKRVVVAASNRRYNAQETEFEKLLGP
jgi:hypothetical protein